MQTHNFLALAHARIGTCENSFIGVPEVTHGIAIGAPPGWALGAFPVLCNELPSELGFKGKDTRGSHKEHQVAVRFLVLRKDDVRSRRHT